ncbi:FAD-binding oxidoreductase [archaeon]|nr:FAD-binding oxidoreductase [archaeon]
MKLKETVCYNSDASRIVGKAEKVFFPKNVEEVQQIIKTTNLDIVPRGAGSGLMGGCVPNSSVVVDLSKMNNVSEFKFKERSVRVGAGVTIKELNEKLNQVGFEFPIKINNPVATIGGAVALNSFGEYGLKYGSIKEWIEEVEFVNGRGELMKTTKADVSDVCGMEGTTGIICSVTLRVIPKVNKSISLFQSDNLEEVFSIARRLKLEKEVIMMELFPPMVSKLLGFPETYNLVIEFGSERGKIRGKEYDELLKAKDKVFSVMFSQEYYNVDDPKFFFDKVRDFISFLDLNEIPYVSYLGAGIVHPFFKDFEKNKKNAVVDFIKKSRAKVSKFGIGSVRKEFLDSFEKKVIERVKLRHDPFGKLNKGKLIDVDAHEKRLGVVGSEVKKVKSGFGGGVGRGGEKGLGAVGSEVEERKPIVRDVVKRVEEVKKVEVLKKVEPLVEEKKTVKSILESMEKKKEIESAAIKDKEFSKPKTSAEDYKIIQDIMNNRKGRVEDKPVDDFEKKPGNEASLPKKEEDSDDKDLINRIMTNKFEDDDEK